MTRNESVESLKSLEVPGRIAIESGPNGLPKLKITTRWSQAEVYLHGAQVTGFRKHGEEPLLFLSNASRFAPGKAIRGGIPICFPWFGPHPGDVAHGFARITEWELAEATADDGAFLRFRLPTNASTTQWRSCRVELSIVVQHELKLELSVTNTDRAHVLEFEACFHTYFAVGDIDGVSVTGLADAAFTDHVTGGTGREPDEPVRITAQTDRTYFDHLAAVEIHDLAFERTIQIEKTGSASTVLWNPWTTQPLADLGDGEYRRMLCVESGNIGRNRVRLPPGETSRMGLCLRSQRGA